LLTTIMHEMGHSLGYEHSDSLDLMGSTLLPGVRKSLAGQSVSSFSGSDADFSWNDQSTNLSALDRLFAAYEENGKRRQAS
jgi:hypothetical protein